MSSPSHATSTASLILTVISPSHDRRQVRVDRSPFRIGRLPDRELPLKDSRISRSHAQILKEGDSYFIEDCESRHGVFVNGRKVQRARLRSRDRIDFGVQESYVVFVGDHAGDFAPLLRKVAELPAPGRTGSLNRLSAVLDVARALESSGTIEDVLAAAVDAALSVTGAERGFLLLKSEEGDLEIRVARDDTAHSLPPDELRVPHKVLQESLQKRNDLFSMSFDPNVESAARDAGQTAVALDLRSVLCVPLLRLRLNQEGETSMLSAKRDTLGLLYMDSRQIGVDLATGNKELLQTLAIEISTVLENARLLDEERKKHHLEQELQIAREIQQALLPASLPSEGWFVAAGSSEACFQVGGDYYDVIKLDGGSWGVVLADVSGKGVSAALMTSLLQGAFFASASSRQPLSDLVARINRYISERSRNARFSTAFCFVVDPDGSGRWVNAGHCAGLLVRAGGDVEWLKPTSVPIGLFPDAEFPQEELSLKPGDKLVLYSDGVSEAANYAGDRFGEERLSAFVTSNPDLDPRRLHAALLEEVAVFTQGAEQGDDLTLLVIGYQGEGDPKA